MTQAMRKDEVPESFGVFKPVGHVVLAFADDNELRGAYQALLKAGFGQGSLVEYTAEEMQTQIDHELQVATGAAGFGYEINLLKLHKQLADQGHGWLIVHAPEESEWTEVARIAKQFHASAAHRYGKLVVEELLVPPQAKAGF